MLTTPATSRAATLSTACLGLMACLPFLIPVHQLPLPSFHSEWLAALVGVLAALALCIGTSTWRWPAVAGAPAALGLLVVLQWSMGMFAFGASALLILLYFVWTCLLMVVARTLAEQAGASSLIASIAWALLAGGLVNGAFGISQYLQMGLPFVSQVEPGAGVYGNLAQQNHFATQMALALASAAYLGLTRRLALPWGLGAALALMVALALSASRSSVLYLLWIAASLAWLLKSNLNPRRIGLGLAALAGVVLLLFAAAGLAGHLPLVERMLDPASALGPRLYAWKLAWHIFTSAPLLGVGFDAFAFHMVSQLSLIEVGKVWGVDQYAHNLLLQLLAVSGLAGLLALSLPVLGFAKRLWQEKASAERTWAACVLGVLFVHSMLEQPLYHTYFLGIAGVVAGLIDPRAFAFRLPAWPRRLAVLALVLSLGLLVKTAVEYGTLHDNYFSEAGLSPQQNSQFIRSLHAHSLLAPMAELVSPGDIVAADAPVAQKLALSDRVRHFAPTAEHEFRHAALLAEAGQVPMAKQQYLRAARAYPIEMTQYQQRFQALAASDPATFGELAAFANSIGR